MSRREHYLTRRRGPVYCQHKWCDDLDAAIPEHLPTPGEAADDTGLHHIMRCVSCGRLRLTCPLRRGHYYWSDKHTPKGLYTVTDRWSK